MKSDDELAKLDAEIGARIRHIRHLRGLSAGKLADKIGVSRRTIEKYESGASRVYTSTLIRLGRALEVCPGALLGTRPPQIRVLRPVDSVLGTAGGSNPASRRAPTRH